MRLSLTFCLLVASTAIGGKTYWKDTVSPRCRALLRSAHERSEEIIPLWDINNDLADLAAADAAAAPDAADAFLDVADAFPQEALLEKYTPTLIQICAAKESRKNALKDILEDIDDECGKNVNPLRLLHTKDPRKLVKEQIAALDAICYIERDTEGSLQFVALNNPWVFLAFQEGFSKAEPNSNNFRCTKGNQHVLGTLNHHVAGLKNVVDFAKVECKKKPGFVEDLDSAINTPYPNAQKEWEDMHKALGEMLDKEIKTWSLKLKRSTKELRGILHELPTLEKKLKEKDSHIKGAEDEIKKLKDGTMYNQLLADRDRDVRYQFDRVLEKNDEIRQLEKDIQKITDERDDARSKYYKEFSRNDPKNSATSTSIPAISGFLSLAFLASQY